MDTRPRTSTHTVAGAAADVTELILADRRLVMLDRARIHVCGITPYDVTHLGHAATFVWVDTLSRDHDRWCDAARVPDPLRAAGILVIDPGHLKLAQAGAARLYPQPRPPSALAPDQMVLLPTFRLPTQFHTRSANSKWLDELAHTNPVWTHPSDTQHIGIQRTGDLSSQERRAAFPATRSGQGSMRRNQESERLRNPQPLIRRRLPSGRGATEQPNITREGEAALTPVFWLMVALTGVATGLFGDLMMLLLFNVQYLAFGYHTGTLQAAAEHASAARRVSSLLIAGAFGGVAWFLLRRYTKGEHSEVDDAIWNGEGRLSLRRCLGTSVISEIVIGMGASIGREAAPKLLGGASASVLSSWAGLSVQQRRLLVACGASAGLAAVYNVPLGGAVFTAEILRGSISLPVMLPALACAFIATATGWLYLPSHATYLGVPDYRFSWSELTWALLAGPVFGLISAGYIRLIGWVSHHRATGRKALIAPLLAFGMLEIIGIWYPQLFGNGKDMAGA
jgi:hypothetical protein